ncbi:hypothetical protein B0T24DRAFT_700236 [Lasiosphaeria ovina]|uniref:Retrotransposon gag domain-containing protein n=1 Tax=Lasiosphaeria ovina TaxID=92902 RepID=A0AAE0NA98_9PEZI|nr:hypothetical protein B0T24DRAFT_700236 [Lasiosphaeria ovina]
MSMSYEEAAQEIKRLQEENRGLHQAFATAANAAATNNNHRRLEFPEPPRYNAFLTGDALTWFEPIQRDHLEKGPKYCSADTAATFNHYDNFEAKLKTAFAPDYAARFQQISSRLNWNGGPKMVAFHRGLEDEIKGELAK